jgi:myo-inositol 2-dehydrogenase/D-chiro-inositol 1-dehydrogenase
MTVKIGILSFAHYHANFWSEALRDDPRADYAGVWDADASRGEERARQYGARFVGELDRLLDEVDAVAVTSETAKHRPLIERAAAKGRHILCEKPIATSREDCAAITATIVRSGVTFMQSFPKRFDPVNHELKRLVDTGALGKVWLARVRHGHRHGLDPAFTTGWWAQPALSGGGTLIDEGVHAADFLRWLFGDPQSVTAMTSNAALALAVDDTASATFRWADGLIAEVATGWQFQAADSSVELYGSKGSAVLSGVDIASRDTQSNSPYLRVCIAGDGERRWSTVPLTPRFVEGRFHHQSMHAFITCLVESKPPPITFADGEGALAMILAAYAAARSGREQRVCEFRSA